MHWYSSYYLHLQRNQCILIMLGSHYCSFSYLFLNRNCMIDLDSSPFLMVILSYLLLLFLVLITFIVPCLYVYHILMNISSCWIGCCCKLVSVMEGLLFLVSVCIVYCSGSGLCIEILMSLHHLHHSSSYVVLNYSIIYHSLF